MGRPPAMKSEGLHIITAQHKVADLDDDVAVVLALQLQRAAALHRALEAPAEQHSM